MARTKKPEAKKSEPDILALLATFRGIDALQPDTGERKGRQFMATAMLAKTDRHF